MMFFKQINKQPLNRYFFSQVQGKGKVVQQGKTFYQLSDSLPPNQGQVLHYKNNLVFFSSFEGLKSNSFLKLNGSNQEAITLSINDQYATGLVLEHQETQVLKDQSQTIQINDNNSNLQFNFDFENSKGKILGFRGNDLNNNVETKSQNKIEIFSKSRVMGSRAATDSQVYTGNIQVDYSNPIAKGNFVVFKGNTGTGKTHLANSTAINFLKGTDLKQVDPILKRHRHAVIVSTDHKEAEKSFSQIQNSLPEDLKNNITIFSPGKESTLASRFLLPYTAEKFANEVRFQQNTDVIYIFNGVYEHSNSEQSIFRNLDMPFSTVSIAKELFSNSGNFKQGSMTSLLLLDENKVTDTQLASQIKLKDEYESLADVIVNFELNQKEFRNVKPKIKFSNKASYFRQPWQAQIMTIVSRDLISILNRLEEERHSVESQKQLNIHLDPWDQYFYLDSKYFMPLLISDLNLSPIEQLVFVKFVVICIQEEIISQFRLDPKKLTTEFFKFAKEFNEFEGQLNIFDYISDWIDRGNDEKTNENLIECIGRVYQIFIMHLKMNDQISPLKKDYF